MYFIEKKFFGIKLIFGGLLQPYEMRKWLEESKKVLNTSTKGFSVYIDARTLSPLSIEVQKFLEKGRTLFKACGMNRSVVIVDNPLIKLQFKRIASKTGTVDTERYLDITEIANWKEKSIKWLELGVMSK